MNKLPEELASKKIILCKEEPFFISPEGEGKWTGRLCAWMRVSTCNLSCAWKNNDGTVTLCDTPYTSHKPSKHIVTAEEAFTNLMGAKTSYVSLSGGEPYSQPNMISLIDYIEDAGKRVKIETNGTHFIKTKASLVSMSPKLHSSASGILEMSKPEYHNQDTNNFLQTSDFELQARRYKSLYERHEANRYNLDEMKKFLDHHQENILFKFVVNTELDMEEIITRYVEPLNIKANQVWLMPQAISTAQLDEKAQWVIEQCKQYGFSYSDRLHIRIYGNKSGV